MSATRRALARALLVLSLVLVSMAPATSALGAESPLAAAEALIATIESGDLTTLDGIVCEQEQEAIRAIFDPASIMADMPEGVDIEALLAGLTINLEEGAVELVSEEDESAVVRITGELRISIIGLSESEAVDEEFDVILEGGEWLICSGLGLGIEDGASISEAGLCAALTIDKLSALGEPQYASSLNVADACIYDSTGLEADGFHSLFIEIVPGTLDDQRGSYAEGTELTVAGSPAFATMALGGSVQLWVELPDGELLAVTLYVDESALNEAFDLPDYAARIAEIVLPRVSEVERFDFGSLDVETEPGEGSDTTAGVDLCAVITLDELNALSPLLFDQVDGTLDFCTYTNTDISSGFYFVSTSLAPGDIDDFKSFFPGGEDVEVAGLPGYIALEQLWIALDEGVLAVSAFVEGTSGAEDLDNEGFAALIAEAIIPHLVDPDADEG